jgi:hypothetical protein
MRDSFRIEQQQRLEEMRTNPEPNDEWPRGCRGSRRPWLVFIGPSPRGKQKIDEPGSPLWNKPFTDPFLRWGSGFKKSMKPLLRMLMPEASETEAPFLYAVYNLDSVEERHAERVPSERTSRGASAVLALLDAHPPRLIVPMETHCDRELLIALKAGYQFPANHELQMPAPIPIYDNANGPQKFHRSLSGFVIHGNGPLNGSVVVRLPQHPAHMFTAAYAERCGKAVRNVFEQLAAAGT